MEVAIVCGISDDKVYAELLPISKLEEVEKIYLIRRHPLKIKLSKLVSISPPAFIRDFLIFAELYRIVTLLVLCIIKPQIKIVIGIYFIPHGLYVGVLGRLLDKHVIQYLIGTDLLKVMKSSLFIKIINWAHYIGVRGKTSQKQLEALGISPDKFFFPTGANSIDFVNFVPSQQSKQYDLIYVGRIDKNKQVEKLVEAIYFVKCKFTDISVAIIGDGPERTRLEKKSHKLHLNNNVLFLGARPYNEIPYYLKQSRVFMMASDFEGLPVAMLEALSCGLPVVVPDVGDITDIALHGVNAWVVDSPEMKKYVEAFTKILEDQSLYLQLARGALSTREMLISKFSLENAKLIWKSVLS